MKNIFFLIVCVLCLYHTSIFCQTETQHVILMSVSSYGDTTEMYTITEARLNKLPMFDPLKDTLPVSIERLIQIANSYVKTRYPDLICLFESIKLQQFDHYTNIGTRSRDWVVFVSFRYDKRGYVQIVPILLDGTIVEGKN